jgi:hypothetical protein
MESRPDIVIERVLGDTSSAILLELKATRSASYLSQGLMQLIGYLADRPALFTTHPSGWLVAPESSAFQSELPDGSPLHVVTADAVSQSAVLVCQSSP